MQESRALEGTIKSFLLGVGVGTLVGAVLTALDDEKKPVKKPAPERDIVDIASEESFPASDSPAY